MIVSSACFICSTHKLRFSEIFVMLIDHSATRLKGLTSLCY